MPGIRGQEESIERGCRKMKVIHCADLHLDSKMTANLTKEKAKGGTNNARTLKTFSYIP